MPVIRVGVDIGGTFTDLVFLDEDGNRYFGKTLTTYPDPSDGFLKGLDENIKKFGFAFSDIQTIIHGTTLVVNALIERRGARTALITTKGFRDQLEFGAENRYDSYDLFIDKPAQLVPRYLRFTVRERILANGEVLEPLNEADVRGVLKQIEAQGVEAVAVCLLHSYRNGAHETRIKEIAREEVPHIVVAVSSEVSPEIREFHRASTTVANVYVQPLVGRYLTALEKEFKKRGFTGQFHLMLSGGGTCTVETACRVPIRILDSGPVGGAIAGAFFSKLCNLPSLLCFDMGGTTAKSSLIDNRIPLVATDSEVGREDRFKKGSGIPIKAPVIEMTEIGAGGGSIAHIDRMGLLKVGPQSASSEPGPACYGRGGTMPTVTDADLVLGYLNPDYFLGGEMSLNIDASYKAIEETAAKPLGISVVEAAWGIHRLVNENMANAARIHAVEKGIDIRSYAMFANGGAGPVHACNVAALLDLSRVISPVGAGVCSAFGFLVTPLAFDYVRSYHNHLDSVDWSQVMHLFTEMEKEGISVLQGSGIDPEYVQIQRSCEMRYVGQSHEIRVPIPDGELTDGSLETIRNNFSKKYEELYSEASKGMPIETVNWRVVLQGPTPKVSLKLGGLESGKIPEPENTRKVYFGEDAGYRDTPVYKRSRLSPGMTISGPAIIEERESTLVVTPIYSVTVDPFLNLIIEKGMKQTSQRAEHFKKFDPIQVEIMWNRFVSILEEQAKTLIRTAFSSILADAEDLSAGLFDRKGNMIAQARTGVPGHINSMAIGVKHFLKHFPQEMLDPGDVLIGNNGYEISGHKLDVTIVTPVFYKNKLIGYFASTCHVYDLGGVGFSSEGRNTYEEGLHIPYLKYYKQGRLNEDVQAFIVANSRSSYEVLGDLRAQIIAQEVAIKGLMKMLEEFNLGEIDTLGEEIMTRSEMAMRKAIAQVPDGVYTHEIITDGIDEPIRLKCAITVKDDEIWLDFDGSSPANPSKGINSCLNYTKAYSIYAIKAVIARDVPNNEGSFRPMHITAPEGCILNATHPLPTTLRHIMGFFIPSVVLGALSHALPELVPAEGATVGYPIQAYFEDANYYMLCVAGGMGARPNKDGLSTTNFPTNTLVTPIEIAESGSPFLFYQKELLSDSGGSGQFRGGLGQVIRFGARTKKKWRFPTQYDRIIYPALADPGGRQEQPGKSFSMTRRV